MRRKHKYRVVNKIGWRSRRRLSPKIMWCGLFLLTIFVSLAFYNEQRSDYSILARGATIVSPLAIPSQVQGEIVAVTGTISTPELVGDNLLLKPTASTVLVRTVEMFSWRESATTKVKKQVGGSRTNDTTYTYRTEWTDSPSNSRQFRQKNYINPPKAVPDRVFAATTARIGQYNLDLRNLKDVVNLPSSCTSNSFRYVGEIKNEQHNYIHIARNSQLILTPQQLLPSTARLVRNSLFLGAGTPQNPRVGDLRICYSSLPTNVLVTAIGRVQDNWLAPIQYEKRYFSWMPNPILIDRSQATFFRLAAGNYQSAIWDLKWEFIMFLWGGRMISFLGIWCGLILLTDLFRVVFSFIPWLGVLADWISIDTSFVLALIIFTTIVMMSSPFQSLLELLGIELVMCVLFLIYRNNFYRDFT